MRALLSDKECSNGNRVQARRPLAKIVISQQIKYKAELETLHQKL